VEEGISLAQRYPTATVIGTYFSNYAVESANSKIPLMVENLTFKTEDAQNLSSRIVNLIS
jgi:trans-aconitate methyltransferase